MHIGKGNSLLKSFGRFFKNNNYNKIQENKGNNFQVEDNYASSELKKLTTTQKESFWKLEDLEWDLVKALEIQNENPNSKQKILDIKSQIGKKINNDISEKRAVTRCIPEL